jgi:hypothetical protein
MENLISMRSLQVQRTMQRTVSPKRKRRRPRRAYSKSVMVREVHTGASDAAPDEDLSVASLDSASRARSRIVVSPLPRASARLLMDAPLLASRMARSSCPSGRRKATSRPLIGSRMA